MTYDWLGTVCTELGVGSETYFDAMTLADQYLFAVDTPPPDDTIKNVAIASLYMAAALDEVVGIRTSRFSSLTDLWLADLRALAWNIFRSSHGRLWSTNAYVSSRLLAPYAVSADADVLTKYLTELTMLAWPIVRRYTASRIAFACSALAHAVVLADDDIAWRDHVHSLRWTAYSVGDQQTAACVVALCAWINQSDSALHKGVRNRYASVDRYTIPPPDRVLHTRFPATQHMSFPTLADWNDQEHADTMSSAQGVQHSNDVCDLDTRSSLPRVRINCATVFRDCYEKVAKLGEGSYGRVEQYDVHTAIHAATTVAVKKFNDKQVLFDSADQLTGPAAGVLREMAVLSLPLNDDNHVLPLWTCYVDLLPNETSVRTVFPFAEGGSLFDLFQRVSAPALLTRSRIRTIVRQLAHGLSHLHDAGITHRDLKPQNIVFMRSIGSSIVDLPCDVRLIDFGLARRGGTMRQQKFTGSVCTLWYRAPELLLGDTCYNAFAIDLWSLGIIVAELGRGGATLIGGSTILEQLFGTFRQLGTPNNDIWPGVESKPQWRMTFPQYKHGALNKDAELQRTLGDAGMQLMFDWLMYDPTRRVPVGTALLESPFLRESR